jgi:hypothetical protein
MQDIPGFQWVEARGAAQHPMEYRRIQDKRIIRMKG